MATSQETKCRAMDAVTHRETGAQIRSLRGKAKAAAPSLPQVTPRASVLDAVKRKAMDAVSHVETVAQIGTVKVAAAAAAYVGHIRQADRDMQRQRTQRGPRSVEIGRERLE